jgi:LmbE family N-acetylglucosaminyl deacetylase
VSIARDLTGTGTPEVVWAAAGLPADLPVLDLDRLAADRVVLVAPHPDDEVLGAGATAAALGARGARVHIVAVTDGEASHPGRAEELRGMRASERTAALARLGLSTAKVHRLHQPDGGVHAAALAEQLRPLVTDGDVVLAPWRYDGHPDHDACGEAVALLPGRHWSYLVWAWHWARPADLPWERALRVPLNPAALNAKRTAVAAFDSQLVGDSPILPAHVLDRLLRPDEVLIPEAQ